MPTFAMPARDVTNQATRVLSLWQGSWIAALTVGAITWGLILWPVIAHR
ncbi:MAG: cytochrome c oxidase subunit, partial [Solirubrobacterales bacterium]|nr:cytochrome c oxidase subunit [Solirubrobacterales bacterium]